ncbi:hypothetical protein EDD36DRAFT_105981 [Exophiala viscosa]|uniref:DUF4211 domain-containing protein n=1 Tax=Exophiala viscosa TaxID=2486360 RepID=A0AAN6I850_9EURO|nr:hypothetical protein EDD36DRAFT_105981 [Exophiala viscosa]
MANRSRPTAPRRSVRNRKKQTTLQLSPLPSSSPAKEKYSPAVQDRLASVRYHGAKGSRREVDKEADEVDMLPTPEPSSQIRGRDEGNAQASLLSSPTPVRSVNVVEEDDSNEDDLIQSASKRRRLSPYKTSTNLTSSPLPRRSARFHSGTSSQLHELAIEPEDSPAARRSGRRRRRSSPQSARSHSQSSQSVVSVEIATPPRPTTTMSDLGSAETSDEDDKILASMPTSRRRKSKAVTDDPFVVSDDQVRYVSDEDVPSIPTNKSRRKNHEDDFVVGDEDIEYVSSEEDDRATANSRYARKLSRSHKSSRESRRQAEQEQVELEEDLQDLQDSDHDDGARKTRTRGGPVTTQRDKAREHFDLLRRRRAGEKVPRVVDSDDEEEEEESEGVDINYIGRPHEEILSVHSSVDTDQESVQESVQEEEDDFIIEENSATGRFGRPHPDMPLQFTSFASSKPRDLFPHIIEWLVKNKIAPAFSRDDEVFSLAFDRLEDQVKAQAGSRLISSAWGSDFKRAILARPGMKVVALPGMDEDNMRTCDACNRTNHPARYEFVFSGEPYYKKTLEPVDTSDDEDEESHDDGPSYDENGHILPSVHRRYYLGRFCAANAEMGHKLTHWKYHLNESLMAYLEEQGVLSADAIVARDKMNKKKREKEAENVVDSMEEIGVIGEMWKDFENDLNDARLGMEDFEKKGGRSKGRVGAIRSTANGLVREWSGDRYRVTKAADSDSEGD